MLRNAIWLFILTVFVFTVFLPSYTKWQDLKQKNFDYQAEIVRLKKANEDLRREKKRLEEDPVYLEKVAREKMGLVKDGEVVVRLPEGLNEGK